MQSNDGPDQWGNYTNDQAAQIVGVTPTSLKRYRLAFDPPVLRVGNKIIWPIEAINHVHNRLVQSRRQEV